MTDLEKIIKVQDIKITMLLTLTRSMFSLIAISQLPKPKADKVVANIDSLIKDLEKEVKGIIES